MLGNNAQSINQNARQDIQMAKQTQSINRSILITSMKPHNNGVVAHTQAEAKCTARMSRRSMRQPSSFQIACPHAYRPAEGLSPKLCPMITNVQSRQSGRALCFDDAPTLGTAPTALPARACAKPSLTSCCCCCYCQECCCGWLSAGCCWSCSSGGGPRPAEAGLGACGGLGLPLLSWHILEYHHEHTYL